MKLLLKARASLDSFFLPGELAEVFQGRAAPPGVNILAYSLKFTTCAPLNFFVCGPISIDFFSAES